MYESAAERHEDEAGTSSAPYLNPGTLRMDRAVDEHPKPGGSALVRFEED